LNELGLRRARATRRFPRLAHYPSDHLRNASNL
jgi:hypothetical protein